MKLEITEDDHRRIDAAVAEHDPARWLVTNRVRLFSEEDADWYADHSRAELRQTLMAALISEAVGRAITELGGGSCFAGDLYSIETEVREMLVHNVYSATDRNRWGRLLGGTSDDATDEDWSSHHDALRGLPCSGRWFRCQRSDSLRMTGAFSTDPYGSSTSNSSASSGTFHLG